MFDAGSRFHKRQCLLWKTVRLQFLYHWTRNNIPYKHWYKSAYDGKSNSLIVQNETLKNLKLK